MRLRATDRTTCNDLIIALWPNTARWMASPERGGTEAVAELLDRICRACDVLTWEQIDAMLRDVFVSVKSSTVPIVEINRRLRDLVRSETTRRAGGCMTLAGDAMSDAADGNRPPWRVEGMTMTEWLDAISAAGRDLREALRTECDLRHDTIGAILRLRDRGELRTSDVANAIACGEELARSRMEVEQ